MLVTSSFSSLLSSLELSDTKAYEPETRALLGTASHFCEVVVLELRTKPQSLTQVLVIGGVVDVVLTFPNTSATDLDVPSIITTLSAALSVPRNQLAVESSTGGGRRLLDAVTLVVRILVASSDPAVLSAMANAVLSLTSPADGEDPVIPGLAAAETTQGQVHPAAHPRERVIY